MTDINNTPDEMRRYDSQLEAAQAAEKWLFDRMQSHRNALTTYSALPSIKTAARMGKGANLMLPAAYHIMACPKEEEDVLVLIGTVNLTPVGVAILRQSPHGSCSLFLSVPEDDVNEFVTAIATFMSEPGAFEANTFWLAADGEGEWYGPAASLVPGMISDEAGRRGVSR